MTHFRWFLVAGLALAVVHAGPELDAALSLKKAKHYSEARAALEAVVAAEPKNAAACYHLGMVWRLRNDDAAYAEALKWLAKAVDLEPTNATYLADYGGTSMEYADRVRSYSAATKGRDAMEKSLTLDPGNLDARQGLYEFYHYAPWPLGSSAKAAAQLAEIRRRDPDRATIIAVVGRTDAKDFTGAFNLCEDLLARQPGDYTARFQYGRTAALSGQNLALGLTHLKSCLRMDPPRPSSPPHPAVWLHLGQIEQKLNHPAAAREAYTMALKLNPNFREATDALAKLN